MKSKKAKAKTFRAPANASEVELILQEENELRDLLGMPCHQPIKRSSETNPKPTESQSSTGQLSEVELILQEENELMDLLGFPPHQSIVKKPVAHKNKRRK